MTNHFNDDLYKIGIFVLNIDYKFLYCRLFINTLLKRISILYK